MSILIGYCRHNMIYCYIIECEICWWMVKTLACFLDIIIFRFRNKQVRDQTEMLGYIHWRIPEGWDSGVRPPLDDQLQKDHYGHYKRWHIFLR